MTNHTNKDQITMIIQVEDQEMRTTIRREIRTTHTEEKNRGQDPTKDKTSTTMRRVKQVKILT